MEENSERSNNTGRLYEVEIKLQRPALVGKFAKQSRELCRTRRCWITLGNCGYSREIVAIEALSKVVIGNGLDSLKGSDNSIDFEDDSEDSPAFEVTLASVLKTIDSWSDDFVAWSTVSGEHWNDVQVVHWSMILEDKRYVSFLWSNVTDIDFSQSAAHFRHLNDLDIEVL